VHLSFKTASIANKMLRLLPNKIRVVEAITREHIFVNTFLQGAVHDSVLEPETCMFFSYEACFHLIGYNNLRTIIIATILTRERILKYPFPIRRFICGVPLMPVK
jgi:hypothetical protein